MPDRRGWRKTSHCCFFAVDGGWGSLPYQEGDLLRLQFLFLRKFAIGTSPDIPDHIRQFSLDNVLPEFFVRKPELLQVVVIEKMAEGAVSHIVEQGRHSQEFLNVVCRRAIRHRGLERRVEMGGKPARQVHGAERMLEPAVLGRGIHPPGALELIDLTQALHPGCVDQVLFGLLPCHAGSGKGDIPVDRIAEQGRTVVEFFTSSKLTHGAIIP